MSVVVLERKWKVCRDRDLKKIKEMDVMLLRNSEGMLTLNMVHGKKSTTEALELSAAVKCTSTEQNGKKWLLLDGGNLFLALGTKDKKAFWTWGSVIDGRNLVSTAGTASTEKHGEEPTKSEQPSAPDDSKPEPEEEVGSAHPDDTSAETRREDPSTSTCPTTEQVVPDATISVSKENGPEPSGVPPSVAQPGDLANWKMADVGCRVVVNDYGEGTLRFVGHNKASGKPRLGIELDAGSGKMSGSVRGVFYFKCAKGKGLLTAPKNVHRVASPARGISRRKREGGTSGSTRDRLGSSARASFSRAPRGPQIPGVSVVKRADASDDAALRDSEVVEDPTDHTVGEMSPSLHYWDTMVYLAAASDELRNVMGRFHAKGSNRGYSKAYQALAQIGRDAPAIFSTAPENKTKNRYANIPAYDHSRVVLPELNGDSSSTYINANWVPGEQGPRAYIATQGPVPKSFVDFWRMVWFTGANTIVMVTHEVEKGRMKCHRYWPDPTSTPPAKVIAYGSLRVTHEKAIAHPHFVERIFTMEADDSPPRTVKQFAYTSWPDHGVPLTTAELLGFRNAVCKSTPAGSTSPIIVHCSAGVGRTGTYIGIDRLIQRCTKMAGPLAPAIDEVMTEMRKARNHMVQTEMQYIFIYRALADALAELLTMEAAKAEADGGGGRERGMTDAAVAEVKQAAETATMQRQTQAKVTEVVIAAATASVTREAKLPEVGMTIKERMRLLEEADVRAVESYKASMDEWNSRNQFGAAEDYDLSSELTPLQSRLAALRSRGMILDAPTEPDPPSIMSITRADDSDDSDDETFDLASPGPPKVVVDGEVFDLASPGGPPADPPPRSRSGAVSDSSTSPDDPVLLEALRRAEAMELGAAYVHPSQLEVDEGSDTQVPEWRRKQNEAKQARQEEEQAESYRKNSRRAAREYEKRKLQEQKRKAAAALVDGV